MRRSSYFGFLILSLAALGSVSTPSSARADEPTPGFPEPVIQWDVQKGETCEDVAKALYGDARQAHLVMRYNRIVCTRGAPLKAGTTLVMPAKVTTVPSAVLTSLVPSVRAKAAGAGWSDAAPGMPLSTNANVNTMDKASASIHFIDRTKVFLSENTLVVIFGTASLSAVSKNVPPSVEVDSGEIRTALSALRGDAAEVSIPGGGRVSAASRDTVIERKGERTTVSVFDGKAHVANAGHAVDVPLNYGSRFVGAKPPMPPRPLPPAPPWDKPSSGVVVAVAGTGRVEATWKPVDKAKAYRVELATDAAFDNLIAREEVPAETQAFRGSGLPPGSYFLRVRAIDGEDFLGVASAVTNITVVKAVVSHGDLKLDKADLSLSPYASLSLSTPTSMQVSTDDGPFVANPPMLELASTRPAHLTLRIAGADTKFGLVYRMPVAAITVEKSVSEVAKVRVDLTGIEPGLVDAVTPWLRIQRRGSSVSERVELTRAALGTATFEGLLTKPNTIARLEVLDGFGAVLGKQDGAEETPPPLLPPPSKKPPVPRIGVTAQGFGPNPYVVDWLSPTAPNAGSVGFSLEHGFAKGPTNGQGRAQVSGELGPVGLDGQVFTDDLDKSVGSHETAWLGGRVRVLRLKNAVLEIAPMGRVGVGRGARSVLGAAGLAIGGAIGRFSWLTDVAFQFRPEAYPYVPSFIGGATVDATSWLRPFATVDVLGAKISDKGRPGGGLTVGAEAGHIVFGTLSGRVSPFDAPLGGFSGMLSIGVRQEP